MGRDVPFDMYATCDKCQKSGGAFDFMGDTLCVDCYSALPDHDDCAPTCPECNNVLRPTIKE